jgi:hypothetical protein
VGTIFGKNTPFSKFELKLAEQRRIERLANEAMKAIYVYIVFARQNIIMQ